MRWAFCIASSFVEANRLITATRKRSGLYCFRMCQRRMLSFGKRCADNPPVFIATFQYCERSRPSISPFPLASTANPIIHSAPPSKKICFALLSSLQFIESMGRVRKVQKGRNLACNPRAGCVFPDRHRRTRNVCEADHVAGPSVSPLLFIITQSHCTILLMFVCGTIW